MRGFTFDEVALATVRAVCDVEGWCDNHPSLQNLDRTGGEARPSTRFKAELRRQLRRVQATRKGEVK